MAKTLKRERSTVRLSMTTNLIDLKDLLEIVRFAVASEYAHQPDHAEVCDLIVDASRIVEKWEDDA